MCFWLIHNKYMSPFLFSALCALMATRLKLTTIWYEKELIFRTSLWMQQKLCSVIHIIFLFSRKFSKYSTSIRRRKICQCAIWFFQCGFFQHSSRQIHMCKFIVGHKYYSINFFKWRISGFSSMHCVCVIHCVYEWSTMWNTQQYLATKFD